VTFFPDATTTLGQTIRLRIMKLWNYAIMQGNTKI
jgi:hypothetical protein